MVELEIVLGPSPAVYYGDDRVSGFVRLRTDSPIRARSLVVYLIGKARTQWTEIENFLE